MGKLPDYARDGRFVLHMPLSRISGRPLYNRISVVILAFDRGTSHPLLASVLVLFESPMSSEVPFSA